MRGHEDELCFADVSSNGQQCPAHCGGLKKTDFELK